MAAQLHLLLRDENDDGSRKTVVPLIVSSESLQPHPPTNPSTLPNRVLEPHWGLGSICARSVKNPNRQTDWTSMEQTSAPENVIEQMQFQLSLLRLVYHGSVDAGARAETRAAEIEQLLPQ